MYVSKLFELFLKFDKKSLEKSVKRPFKIHGTQVLDPQHPERKVVSFLFLFYLNFSDVHCIQNSSAFISFSPFIFPFSSEVQMRGNLRDYHRERIQSVSLYFVHKYLRILLQSNCCPPSLTFNSLIFYLAETQLKRNFSINHLLFSGYELHISFSRHGEVCFPPSLSLLHSTSSHWMVHFRSNLA